MPEWILIWTHDPHEGNVAHLAEHGVTPEEYAQVVRNPIRGPEPSHNQPAYTVVCGFTDSG